VTRTLVRCSLVLTLLVLATAALAAPLPIRITAAASDGTPLPGTYLALYAPEDPHDRPSFEVIAADGRAPLQVPPGTYRLFAAANGYQPAGERVTVNGMSKGELTINLLPDVMATGTVSDPSGNPIAGAHVRQVRVPLSKMALDHLGARWQTTSDENGWWTLPVPGEFVLPLLVEAPHRAPAWQVSRPAELAKPMDIALAEGGQLTVTLDRAEPELFVSLVSLAEGAVPKHEQSTVWRRDATSTKLEWNALAPGTYRIVATARDPRRFLAERELATVKVTAGDVATQTVALPALPPQRAHAARFFVPGKVPHELEALRAIAATTTAPVLLQRASSGTVVYVDTAAAPKDVFLLTSEAVMFAAPGLEGETVRPVAVTTHHRAEATLKLAAATEGTPLPSSGSVVYRDCERNQRFTVPFVIARDGAVSLQVPTDCKAIALSLPPLETLALPLALRPHESKFLGSHKLEAAARALVHVRREPSGVAVPGATVRALELLDDAGRTLPVAETLADETGFVALHGLPAGRKLLLEARVTGGAATGSMSVQLEPGQELVVDPLKILEPATVVVEPRLPASFRERWPGSRVGAISMQRRDVDEQGRKSLTKRIGEDSTSVTFEDVEPGTWHVMAIVEAAGTGQPIDVDDLELAPGETRRFSPEIEPLVFEGRVVSNVPDKQWSVAVGDPPSPNAIRRRIQTGRDGRFAAVLSHKGPYDVRLRATDNPEIEIEIGEVDFSDPSRPIELVVPEGSLAVTVREGDEPLANASVTATLRRDSLRGGVHEIVRRGTTDTAGRAFFDALPPGRWIARATTGNRAAEKAASVAVDAEAQVQLDVTPANALEGIVRNPDGRPAVQADVDCFYLASTGPVSRGAQTGDDGRFTLALGAEKPASLQCGATTAEGLVGAWVVPQGTRAELTIPAAGAPLTIPDYGERLFRDELWLRSADGRLVSLTWVAGRIGRVWQPLAIPQFPAGSWTLVRADSLDEWAALARGGAASMETLGEVRIQPGQQYQLRINEHQTTGESQRKEETR